MANVKVAVRVRPISGRETKHESSVVVEIGEDNSVYLTNLKVTGGEGDRHRQRVRRFGYDYAYNSMDRNADVYASQELIYQDLGTEVLDAVFEGYNTCLFAYGQTGSGKSYTMMGQEMEIGLIPRICEGLCERVEDYMEEGMTFKAEVSYLEIYNERVKDLLQPHSPSPRSPRKEKYTLKVREHPKDGPYVQDLSRHIVSDFRAMQECIEKGNANRTVASTHMHDHSSRSHAIFTLYFTQAKLTDNMPSEKVSKINLVDLAGSERADPSKSGDWHKGRLKEGANINKSLVTLGNVISVLAENSIAEAHADSCSSLLSLEDEGSGFKRKKPAFIPYRNSVLTWLLKDSLGGNAKTIMIATISPASRYYNESLSTLRYAQRAKRIVNRPLVNQDPMSG